MAMSASFTVVNRDNSLPPLLLPNLNSNPNLNPVNYHDKGYDYSLMSGVANKNTAIIQHGIQLQPPQLMVSGNSNFILNNKEAQLGPSGLTDPMSNSSSAVSLSPSPSVSPLMSAHVPSQVSLQHLNPTLDELAMIATKRPKLSNSSSSSKSSSMKPQSRSRKSSSNSAKRQRVGPSCDKCRVKKIKCDAQSDVVIQDLEVVSLFSPLLHYEFTTDEVLNPESEINQYFKRRNVLKNKYLIGLKDSLAKSRNVTNRTLVKHIDKIVVFQPCSSCQKKKNNLLLTANSTPIEIRQNPKFQKTHELLVSHCNCTFSKGFTRGDISIFTKINYHQKKGKSIGNMLEEEESSIYKMTTADYFAASL
ncbi:Sterol uptake protein 1 [Nakaseomyces bracarensis]|uniref:Sterol uptake protein 1 n=1 Tax=Nakaseomyces bracarensis TaxID=273131 RepID=A0ABR4NVT2_9SACH